MESSSNITTVPVTAVLFTFKQEGVVEAAIRSIFEQTVVPAEIILSDDGSSDGTYAVLERMAAEYKGSSEVRLRRSESNQGWFAHVNACMQMAKYPHVLVFAGDDVSKHNRLAVFWDVIQANPGAKLVWSAMERMHPSGELSGKSMGIDRYDLNRLRGVGASQSWHRDLFTYFGDLPHQEAAEDIVLPFRAKLLNGLHYIPEPLVNWRDRDYRDLNREQLDTYYAVRASIFRKNAATIMLDDLATHEQKSGRATSDTRFARERLKILKRSAEAEYGVISEKNGLKRVGVFLCELPSLGRKAGRRIFHNQILRLPSYLDSAFPRTLVKLLPPMVGVFMAIGTLCFGDAALWLRIPVALVFGLLMVEVTRLLLRFIAKFIWKPSEA